jgi:hypothetical protein
MDELVALLLFVLLVAVFYQWIIRLVIATATFVGLLLAAHFVYTGFRGHSDTKPSNPSPSADFVVVTSCPPVTQGRQGIGSPTPVSPPPRQPSSSGYRPRLSAEQAQAIYQMGRDWSLSRSKVHVNGYDRGDTRVNDYYRNQPGRPNTADQIQAMATGFAAVGAAFAIDYGLQKYEDWRAERQGRQQAAATPSHLFEP